MNGTIILIILVIFMIYNFASVYGNMINGIYSGANSYISGIPSMGGFQLGSYDPAYMSMNSIVRNP